MNVPIMIFDKSFLQMLSPPEVSELSRYFTFASTPLLVSEIIADLKKEPANKDRVPEDVVKALASKMLAVHGLQPADYRMLAISDLCCTANVPMCGQVPVDARAPNVAVTKGPATSAIFVTILRMSGENAKSMTCCPLESSVTSFGTSSSVTFSPRLRDFYMNFSAFS